MDMKLLPFNNKNDVATLPRHREIWRTWWTNCTVLEADIALYSFKRMLLILVGQIMATHRLHPCSSFERGCKATASDGLLVVFSVTLFKIDQHKIQKRSIC